MGEDRGKGLVRVLSKTFIVGRGQDKTSCEIEVIAKVLDGEYPFRNDGEIEFLNLYAVKEENNDY